VLINPPDDVGARRDHFPQDVFLFDDVDVERKVCRARHCVRKRGEVSNAANILKLMLILQPLLNGDNINRLLAIVHLREQFKDDLVPQIVEDGGASLELLDAIPHALVRRKKDAAQHALLRLRRMRRQPVH
jgi:hypothetical protein